jgi:predicted O-methyltransferase YrrM
MALAYAMLAMRLCTTQEASVDATTSNAFEAKDGGYPSNFELDYHPDHESPFLFLELDSGEVANFTVKTMGDVTDASKWACQGVHQRMGFSGGEPLRNCTRQVWKQYLQHHIAFFAKKGTLGQFGPTGSDRTNVWFEAGAVYWPLMFYDHVDFDRELHIIEIGSFEGGSTNFFQRSCLHHPKSTLTCIDTWAGVHESNDEARGFYGGFTLQQHEETFQRFRHNVRVHPHEEKVRVIRSDSWHGLQRLGFESFESGSRARYDVAYIDGSHHSADVLAELVLCFNLLRVGGIIILDDYTWGSGGDDYVEEGQTPKLAIDMFMVAFQHQVTLLHKRHQVAFKKTGERFTMAEGMETHQPQ